MVADSSSHDSATTENDGEGVYILLLATELRTGTFFFTKLVCDYAVAIVVVCREIPKLSAYISRYWT